MAPSSGRARTQRAPGVTRERILRSGLTLVRRSGLRALTVRAVAAHAKVNLGTFVYHFGSRAAFAEELMERWYAPLWAQLQTTVGEQQEPLERFRLLLLQLTTWLADNRVFVGHLVLDAAAQEAAALRFLRSLAERHPALILQAIREAQAARQLAQADPLHLLMFTMSALGFPILLAQGLRARRILPRALVAGALEDVAGAQQIEQRLDWVLAGIGGKKGRKR